MSSFQDAIEINEINEYQFNFLEESQDEETGETSSFTRSRTSSISDIGSESIHSSIMSKKRRYDGPGGSLKKSFVWKYFNETTNPNGPGRIMTCTLNDPEGRPCQKTYTAFGSTSNAIQHLASVHGIVEQGKIHIKVIIYGCQVSAFNFQFSSSTNL
jgi:hypothetical protein